MPNSNEFAGNSQQSAIINAFYAADYEQVIRLCGQVLNVEPNNTLAQDYLAKVEEALDEGYGFPLELRRRFHQANRLAQLQQYAEARTIYEQIIQESRSQGIPRWGKAEEALLYVESCEAALPLVERADECFTQDAWEEAVSLYRQALEIAPDFERVRAKLSTVALLADKASHIEALLSFPLLLNREVVGRLEEAVREAHLLLLERPDSGRLQDLRSSVEEAQKNLAERLRSEITECLELGQLFERPSMASAILRRARTLLSYAEGLAFEGSSLDILSARLYTLETKVGFVRDFETQIAAGVDVEEYVPDNDLGTEIDAHTLLNGMYRIIKRMEANWHQFHLLSHELDLCRAALACESVNAIVHLPYIENGSQPGALLWWEPWERARSMILEVSKILGLWHTNPSSDHLRRVYSLLDDMQQTAGNLIYPLKLLVLEISRKWIVVVSQDADPEGV